MTTKRRRVPSVTAKRSVRGSARLIPLLLWSVFVVGLAIQGFAPGLKIENHAFLMPSPLLTQAEDIRPDSIVRRERTMQWASGLCTLGGALALAFWYRRSLAQALQFRSHSDDRGAAPAS